MGCSKTGKGNSMTATLKLLTTTALAIGLAGCTTVKKTDPVTISETEEASRVFAQGTGDLGDALTSGATVVARSVGTAGMNLNYDTGETSLVDAEVEVSQNANGELTVTVNGSTYAFDASHRRVETSGETYGYETDGSDDNVWVSAFNYTGEIDDLLNPGNGYLEVLGIQTNQVNGGEPSVRAFAVVGTETEDAALAALPTATYRGRSQLQVVPTTGFVNNGTSQTRLRSDLTMTADFGAGTVSGVLDNFTVQDAGSSDRNPVDGTIAMDETNFDVNGFRGSLSADVTFAGSLGISSAEGEYSGAFYGPEAEEVGGTTWLTATDTDGATFNGIGYFAGDQYVD